MKAFHAIGQAAVEFGWQDQIISDAGQTRLIVKYVAADKTTVFVYYAENGQVSMAELRNSDGISTAMIAPARRGKRETVLGWIKPPVDQPVNG